MSTDSQNFAHKGDPLYETRRALRRRTDRLSDRALQRVEAALAVGDADGELAVAWWAAQQICLASPCPTRLPGGAMPRS